MKALKSLRLHIGIFGKTNVGKSSFLNCLSGQNVSIVSNIAGTTTDVVEKSMELFPIGPVTFLDTAGLDDESVLGQKRVEKTLAAINRVDVAVVITDYNGISEFEKSLILQLNDFNVPFLIVINKIDEKMPSDNVLDEAKALCDEVICVSSNGGNDNLIFDFQTAMMKLLPDDFLNPPKILGDIIKPQSHVVLVTPIDKEAPKGRIILPQVQTIRDLLDGNCICTVVKESELKIALENMKTPPTLVVTDSQVFKQVNEIVDKNIPLTSFSILFARLKGDLEVFAKGAAEIENLKPNDKVLFLESCTHHAIEDDIARVKIPKLLNAKLGFDLNYEYYTGHDFPSIQGYKLVIHCGACMTNRKEIMTRILVCQKNNIPITNYGMTISYCLGILPRALEIFDLNQ